MRSRRSGGGGVVLSGVKGHRSVGHGRDRVTTPGRGPLLTGRIPNSVIHFAEEHCGGK